MITDHHPMITDHHRGIGMETAGIAVIAAEEIGDLHRHVKEAGAVKIF